MKSKIYDIEYLKKSEFTEDDLHLLFDTDSLIKSLIVHMFKIAGYNYKDSDVINICKKNNWFNKYYISKKKKKIVIDDFIKVIKNVYIVSDDIANKYANDFYMKYGLLNKY